MTTVEVVICREVKAQQKLWGIWNEDIKRMKEQEIKKSKVVMAKRSVEETGKQRHIRTEQY
jgi:hypothetical protein